MWLLITSSFFFLLMNLHTNRYTAEQEQQSLTKSSQINFASWGRTVCSVPSWLGPQGWESSPVFFIDLDHKLLGWVHPLHFFLLEDNQKRGPAFTLVIHHQLIGFADTELQVIAPCDEVVTVTNWSQPLIEEVIYEIPSSVFSVGFGTCSVWFILQYSCSLNNLVWAVPVKGQFCGTANCKKCLFELQQEL